MNRLSSRRSIGARRLAWVAGSALLLAAVVAALAPRAGSAAGSPLDAVTTRAIKDFRASATLSDADLGALRKIGADYANAYRAHTMETYFKEPGRIRFEAKAIGPLGFTQVVNGNTIYISALGMTKTRNIRTLPQARLSSLEIGFITPSALNDFDAKYLGDERVSGQMCHKFELRYKQKDQAKKKILLWADPAKKVLARRNLYFEDGKLKARFTYLSPRQVARGIWVPTHITVHNGQGEFGGSTNYSNIKVNTGVSDDLFKHG